MEGKKKPKFQDILKIFETTDFISGAFLFRDQSNTGWIINRNWTWKDILARMNFFLYPFMSCIFMYGTIYSQEYSTLLGWIFVSSRLAIDVSVYTIMFCVIKNKGKVTDIFAWCSKMYSVQEAFHPKVQKIAEERGMWMHHWALKWLRLYLWSYSFNILLMTVGITVIGFFLPESIYPKFTLPLPYFLPVQNQDTWLVYLISLVIQTHYSIVSASQTTGLAIVYIVSFFIVIYLDIIYRSIELMKQEMEQLTTEHSFERKKKITEEMNQWVPILVEMICGVKEVIDGLNEVFSYFFLIIDLCCYGGVFQFGLLVIVVRKQVIYGMCVTIIIVATFFIFNIVSVTIMDRFAKISDGLYDVPWYALPPPERKLVHHMMLCGKFSGKTGLRAVQFHTLDLERFAKVMKAAYVNCLVLKRLVTD